MSRSRFNPTLGIALLALFLSIAGTGYAITRLNGREIAPRSIPGNRIMKDALGGAEIRESSLGKVPSAARADSARTALAAGSATNAANAAKLGGLPAGAFVQGNGSVFSREVDIVKGSSDVKIAEIEQAGAFRVGCDATTLDPTVQFTNTTGALADVAIGVWGSALSTPAYFGAPIGPGADATYEMASMTWDLQAAGTTGLPRTIELHLTAYTRGGSCRFVFTGHGDLGLTFTPLS